MIEEDRDDNVVEFEYFENRRMMLTGTGFRKGKFESYYGETDVEEFLFVLDGNTFVAQENPEDDYRSCLNKLYVTEDKPTNMFPPVEVVGRLGANKHNDILEFVDAVTGKVVIEVGTGDWDDYYPYYVARFMPKAMVTNMEEA